MSKGPGFSFLSSAKRTICFVVLLITTGLLAHSQSTQAPTPSVTETAKLNVPLPNAPSASVAPIASVPARSAPMIDTTSRPVRQPVGMKLKTAMAFNLLATVADIETTVAALRNPNCREKNPILGSHPSRARLYANDLGWMAVTDVAAYFIQRHWHLKHAWLLPAAEGLEHAGLAAWNTQNGCF